MNTLLQKKIKPHHVPLPLLQQESALHMLTMFLYSVEPFSTAQQHATITLTAMLYVHSVNYDIFLLWAVFGLSLHRPHLLQYSGKKDRRHIWDTQLLWLQRRLLSATFRHLPHLPLDCRLSFSSLANSLYCLSNTFQHVFHFLS